MGPQILAYLQGLYRGDGKGFVRIIGSSRNDTPPQILADFRIGPRNKHHPTLHVSPPLYDEHDSGLKAARVIHRRLPCRRCAGMIDTTEPTGLRS
jgi:hypothetical protein